MALLLLLLAQEEFFLALLLPGGLFLLGQGFILLPGLGLPLAEGHLLLQFGLAAGFALLLGALPIPAEEADAQENQAASSSRRTKMFPNTVFTLVTKAMKGEKDTSLTATISMVPYSCPA